MKPRPTTRLTRAEAIEYSGYLRKPGNFWADVKRQGIPTHQAASGIWYVMAGDLDAFDAVSCGALDYCPTCEKYTDHANESTDAAIIWRCRKCGELTITERGELWGGGKLCYLPRDIRGGTCET